MSATSFDLRRILAWPRAYTALMGALGADAGMERFVRDHLRVRPGERLLDLGCGPGRLYAWLPPVDYWGLDLNPNYLTRARALYPEAHFEQHDVAAGCSGFAAGEFDVVVALGVLHHLPDAAASQSLAFCHDRLRAGGRLITLDGAFEVGQSFLSRMLCRADRGRYVRPARGYLDLAQLHFPAASVSVRHDLLRVPYCHAIVEAVKQ